MTVQSQKMSSKFQTGILINLEWSDSRVDIQAGQAYEKR